MKSTPAHTNAEQEQTFMSLPANTAGRDFVVGDLHGCHGQLMEKLAELNFDRVRDRLFCTGDLIDRGPDSMACLQLVFEPWFFSVRGNHEEMMMAALRGVHPDAMDHWFSNGGHWVYSEDRGEVKQIAQEAMKKMPYAIEVRGGSRLFGIIHADVPGSDWDEMKGALTDEQKAFATWSRMRAKGQADGAVAGIDVVFIGHTIFDKPARSHNAIFIDTGAFKRDGYLSILRMT